MTTEWNQFVDFMGGVTASPMPSEPVARSAPSQVDSARGTRNEVAQGVVFRRSAALEMQM